MSAHRGSLLVASADRLYAESAAAWCRREGWEVVGTAADGLNALAAVARLGPSAVLVLGDLPRLSPDALARQVRRRAPGTAVVVVGGAAAGDGLLLPADAQASEVAGALARPPGKQPGAAAAPERPHGVALLATLTRQERRILRLLAEGRSMEEIGRSVGVSRHTVRSHMQNLYAKLGVHRRLDLVRFAARHGLVGREAGEA